MKVQYPALDANSEAWALAASVASDGLWYFGGADRQLRLAPRAMELLGYTAHESPPSVDDVQRLVSQRDAVAIERVLRELWRGARAKVEMEVQLTRPGKAPRWLQLRARRGQGGGTTPPFLAGALSDVDVRKRVEAALRDGARLDALTGLPNRAALAQRLTARIARASITPLSPFAVMYLDLDRFKVVNDSLGHACGDEMLVEVARRIGSVLGPEDLLARVGGDEFVVVVDDVSDDDVSRRLASAIHAAMNTGVPVAGRELHTTVSIGVRVSGDGVTKPSDMLRDADVAMYRAKHHGGARTMVYDRQMHEEIVDRLRVQNDLHQALRRNELHLVYQPIFDLSEQRLCGFEALLRWHHPTRGRLRATEFVHEANESGLIVHIGRWVLNEVCAQLSGWRREYPNALPLTVTVNLCDREIVDPDFAVQVEAMLEKHGIPADQLTLEMTEGAMTANGEFAVPALRRLRDRGVRIQMDGFGWGSTSLAVLRRMPVSAIKIHRHCIAGVATDEEARAIVATISAYARALGIAVIAEGVETVEQASALSGIGSFWYVQGNHFGRPKGESEAAEMLEPMSAEHGA
ncbi:MAG: EAL domain-containing protein [Gemmatimonadota bacterium]|nr:EAL domain-containing protein [Gemmatimonadota bacterium]